MGRKLGGGAGSPSSRMWPGAEAYLHTKWHLDASNYLATLDMGRKLGALPPFWGGGAGSPSNTKSPGPNHTSIPCGILIHTAILPKQIWAENWGVMPLWGRGGGPHLTHCGQGRGGLPYLHAKFHLDPSSRLATVHQVHRQTTVR